MAKPDVPRDWSITLQCFVRRCQKRGVIDEHQALRLEKAIARGDKFAFGYTIDRIVEVLAYNQEQEITNAVIAATAANVPRGTGADEVLRRTNSLIAGRNAARGVEWDPDNPAGDPSL